MTLGTPKTDHKRVHIALVFLILGLLLLVWAWGSWAYRTSASATTQIVAESPGGQEERGADANAVMLEPWLIIGTVVVLALLIGRYLFSRAARAPQKTGSRRDPIGYTGGRTPGEDDDL